MRSQSLVLYPFMGFKKTFKHVQRL
jgi:hypothetical protein